MRWDPARAFAKQEQSARVPLLQVAQHPWAQPFGTQVT